MKPQDFWDEVAQGNILQGLTSPADRAHLMKFCQEFRKLEAQLWIAKDSQLQTYNGLAQKADTVDKLLPLFNEVLEYLNWLRLDTANDMHVKIITKLRELGFEAKDEVS